MDTWKLVVNGMERTVAADPDKPLLWVLREDLALTGTKFGCGAAMCGCCTVHLDGKAVRSCITPVKDVAARRVTTVEALNDSAVGRAVQSAWIEEDVAQCGYCQPGQMMQASALLAAKPAPSDDLIRSAMAGNLCRCGTYVRIVRAIHRAAAELGTEGTPR